MTVDNLRIACGWATAYAVRMKRVYSIEEWDELGKRREELSARLAAKGFVITRPPLDHQWRKSPQKRALLKKLYGPTGQA